MDDRKYVFRQFFKRNDRGLSKYHIFDVTGGSTRKAICGAESRRHIDLFSKGRNIDRLISCSDYLFKRWNNKQPCKRCLKKAQQFRNPLERLKDIA